jgi:hypothetical protein
MLTTPRTSVDRFGFVDGIFLEDGLNFVQEGCKKHPG